MKATMTSFAVLAVALAGVGAGTALPTSALAQTSDMDGREAAVMAVDDSRRPSVDTSRDGVRKPAEIVYFSGVRPGMKIAEIAPGGGYYTRILAASVGPEGHVYAMMPEFFANRPGGLDGINSVAADYPNVTVVVADFADFELAEKVDLVWTTENYHDFANSPNIAEINVQALEALKPGGIYFVEDHSAPGTGTDATSTIHRIDPMAVIDQVTQAGFVLQAVSDALANPSDPRDVSPRDPAVSPTSEKFALRFVKPE